MLVTISVLCTVTFSLGQDASEQERPSLTLENGAVVAVEDDKRIEIITPAGRRFTVRTDRLDTSIGWWRPNIGPSLGRFIPNDDQHAQDRFQLISDLVKQRPISSAWRDFVRPQSLRAGSHDQFADQINELLKVLKASHCGYYTDKEPAYWELRSIFLFENSLRSPTIGAAVQRIDGEWFVVSPLVRRKPDTEEGEFLAGDRIASIDGGPLSLDGLTSKQDQLVEVQVERKPGEFRTLRRRVRIEHPVAPYAQDVLSRVRIEVHDGVRVGVCRIWWMSTSEMYGAVFSALDRLTDADVVVLDLRDGWGGNPAHYLELIDVDKTFPLAVQPLVVLVNSGTRSAKEWLAYHIQKEGRGILVGSNTAGAMLGSAGHAVGEDGLLVLPVSEIDGEVGEIEGNGLLPDVAVSFDMRYAAGSDPQLERAIEEAKRMGKSKRLDDGKQ